MKTTVNERITQIISQFGYKSKIGYWYEVIET